MVNPLCESASRPDELELTRLHGQHTHYSSHVTDSPYQIRLNTDWSVTWQEEDPPSCGTP